MLVNGAIGAVLRLWFASRTFAQDDNCEDDNCVSLCLSCWLPLRSIVWLARRLWLDSGTAQKRAFDRFGQAHARNATVVFGVDQPEQQGDEDLSEG